MVLLSPIKWSTNLKGSNQLKLCDLLKYFKWIKKSQNKEKIQTGKRAQRMVKMVRSKWIR